MDRDEFNALPSKEDIKVKRANGDVITVYKLKSGEFCNSNDCTTKYSIEELQTVN